MKQETYYPMMQKMQRMVLLTFGLVLAQGMVWAGPRSFRQAQAIAERQAALQGIQMSQQSMTKARMQYQTDANHDSLSASSYYVFDNGDNKGFTIVSGDDQWPEIVGYSAHGNSEEALKVEGCSEFLKAYQQLVDAVNRGDAQAKKLLAERNALNADDSYQQPKVAPLLGDIAWNQTAPFNSMCPEYQVGKKSATGCVATALAQVLMYYKYPKELKADIPAYVTSTLKIEMPAVAKGEKYDWDNMLPQYSANYTQEQADAVAKLMLHCGEATKMDYASSSGAIIRPEVLAKYFGYDADLMQYLYRDSYTLAEWKVIIDRELEAARPLLYSGTSSTNGHQYVCDGADGNGLYHINWGWGGTSNGYYDITLLDPENRGTGAGMGSDGYNRSCTMMIGIAPDNGVADEPLVEHSPLSVMSSSNAIQIVKGERANASEEFTLKIVVSAGNLTNHDFKGLLTVGIKNIDGSYSPISTKASLTLSKMPEDGRYYYRQKEFTFDYAFPVGITRLYALCSTDNGATWDVCDDGNEAQPYEVEATATTLSVSGDKLSAELVGEDEIYSEQDNTFELTLTNGSQHEYLGLVSVYMSHENKMPTFVSTVADADAYVYIPVGGQAKRTFSLSPSAGELYVWITDQNYQLIGDVHQFSVLQSKEAQLALVSKKMNATPGDYEKELAYCWNNDRVAMPKINADKAELTYSIRNNGGTCKTSVRLVALGFDGVNTPFSCQRFQQVLLPGEGTTTDVVFTLTPDDLNGAKSFRAIMSTEKDLDKSAISDEMLRLIDIENSYYPIVGTELVGYIAGTSDTGVEQVLVKNGMQIGTDKGVISILSSANKVVSVYQITGQLAAKTHVTAGVPTTISLRPGIYIVEGTKVVVK